MKKKKGGEGKTYLDDFFLCSSVIGMWFLGNHFLVAVCVHVIMSVFDAVITIIQVSVFVFIPSFRSVATTLCLSLPAIIRSCSI